ncbi:MAG: hypothetical protein K2M19_08310 [Muribaculaceae bacterium]|nr:hypothetical protein [Muribaculaceae bacterium]
MTEPITQEQPCATSTGRRKLTLGLPSAATPNERRFPLTPEGAALLVERGFEIRMQAGAAEVIHFSDDAYARVGVMITDRRTAFTSDIVIHLPAISARDAECLRPGTVLLSLLHVAHQSERAIRQLLNRKVIAIALDLVRDPEGHFPFADILSEIDGHAAVSLAAALLADAVHGKGILLGGIPGVVPCEVTVLGAGIAARAAARAAAGLGATVRMFDNDVYRLRKAIFELGNGVIGSALHPKVLASALRSADVVVATPTRHPVEIGYDMVAEMKRGVIAFDLTDRSAGEVFPSLESVDLAGASADECSPLHRLRVCYVNAGSAVPRSSAMALSNTLLTFFDDIMVCDGLTNALKFNQGLSRAAYTFLGRVVNPDIARVVGQRSVDINLFLQFT